MNSDRFFVITGGPGSGKTTLLNALQTAGFTVVPEVARAIIQEQVDAGGTALPWGNRPLYIQLMLDRSVKSYQETVEKAAAVPGSVFLFDRGIPDALCYARMTGTELPGDLEQTGRTYRYNRSVFILPPWKAIYRTDEERKQDWEEAVYTYTCLEQTYRHQGYHIIVVPEGSIPRRLEFMLQQLRSFS
ncbi:AAA family ATPase [Niabella beijingensis]|uniref:AAA family ATPase n=1 Tax=Niabella beijingensis TaxID=2872700 RepID=UPI001CBCEA56|nr:AAA family ATPase [Niabella beijingensis]MBZ4191024.1 AAA family ATPase [Niabella beijingensis]